jgi:phage terminase small subunit
MANGHGGARDNSGPDKKPAELIDSTELQTDDPIEFLRALMRDPRVDIKLRQDSAKRLLMLTKGGKHGGGKKGERAEAAEVAAEGKFSSLPAPKLRAVK